jgi:hypothetical protein
VRLPAALIAAAVAVLAGGSCGGSAAAGVRPTPPGKIKLLSAAGVPARLGGLDLVKEDVGTTVSAAGKAYVDAVAMYSLKSGAALQATLELSRFNQGARYDTPKFQSGIVNRIGSTTPKRYRLGKDTVYMTTGARQNLAVWFRGRYLVILTVRQDFADARALLRDALEVKP